jgi:hypothetical protein
MVEIYIRGKHDESIPVRFCRRCASPRITYIAGHMRLTRVDVPHVLGFSFGLTIAILNIVLGRLAGGPIGLFVALAGILAGASVAVAFAWSVAMPHENPSR